MLTCDPTITQDVGELFNFLTGFAKNGNYRKIVVSPYMVRDRIVELIRVQRDRGLDGRILIKVNGLTDPTIIDALYEASAAGVEIRLLVRTLCCLRPGVAGSTHWWASSSSTREPSSLADRVTSPTPSTWGRPT